MIPTTAVGYFLLFLAAFVAGMGWALGIALMNGLISLLARRNA